MSENIYEAPSSKLEPEGSEGTANDFYVVSLKKLNVLFFATFSIYAIYWFYKNWQLIKVRENSNIWPVARGVFSIFFTHSLFNKIEARVEQTGGHWKGGSLATLYVVVTLISTVMGYGSNVFLVLLSFTLIIPIWYPLYSAQYKINVICGDPKGDNNSEFTAANYVFIVLGLIVWVIGILGTLAAG